MAYYCHRAHHDELGMAHSLSRLGALAWDLDKFASALEYHLESLAIYQRLAMPMSATVKAACALGHLFPSNAKG